MDERKIKLLKSALSLYGETLNNISKVFDIYNDVRNEYWEMVTTLAEILNVDEFDICEY